MTDSSKLEALIQKAIDGGWEPLPSKKVIIGWKFSVDEFDINLKAIHPKSESSWLYFQTNWLLFNHDFASSLWGVKDPVSYEQYFEDWMPSKRNTPYSREVEKEMPEHYKTYLSSFNPDWYWKRCLQQMVIADDPIDYAYQSLFGENK